MERQGAPQGPASNPKGGRISRSSCLYFYMQKQRQKQQVAALATRQEGRVSWAQLKHLGVADSTISQWVAQG